MITMVIKTILNKLECYVKLNKLSKFKVGLSFIFFKKFALIIIYICGWKWMNSYALIMKMNELLTKQLKFN